MPARIWRNFMRQALSDPDPDTTSGSVAVEDSSSRSCNVSACSRSYRSFRPSDCTYQPYSGERRICER